MAVTSQLTSLIDFSGTPTLPGYGGGQGAAINTDVIIEGGQSAGRRVDNATDKGFGGQFTATDLSATGVHVKVWLFVTQWSEVTQVQIRISSGADDDHDLPSAEFPALGGFIPVWVDVSRAPEIGGSANEASISEVGVLLDIGDVGGNASNLILDEIMYGTSGLLWSGTGGDMGDFRTYEGTNNEGVLVTLNGIDFCYARLEIGDSTATGFTDSGFTLVFPDQSLVASDFMGVTIDLQNASTDVDLSDATIQSSDPSAAGSRPDLIVSGTSGTLTFDSVSLLGMRLVSLTNACTLTGGIIDAVDMLQSGADISGAVIRTRAATSIAAITDPTFGTTTDLHDITFVQVGAGHAFEIDTAGSYVLTNIFFSGYGADTSDAAAIDITASSGTVTLTITGGDTPTYKTAGATVVIVTSTVTATVTVRADGSALENARVILRADSVGPLPYQDSITITRSGSVATASHTAHGLAVNQKVQIEGANQQEYNGVKTITGITTNTYTFTVSGTPTTPATGTIISTAVILQGLTNVSGVISDTRSYSSNQDVEGVARSASGAPYRKPFTIVGTVDSSGGFAITANLIDDGSNAS